MIWITIRPLLIYTKRKISTISKKARTPSGRAIPAAIMEPSAGPSTHETSLTVYPEELYAFRLPPVLKAQHDDEIVSNFWIW